MILEELGAVAMYDDEMLTNLDISIQLHKEVDKLESAMSKSKDALGKAKAKYVKACADYEKSTLDQRAADPAVAKPKELDKLKTRVQADKSSADQAHDAYKQQIAEHRNFQQKYEEQFRNILQQFGELEMKRREELKKVMVQFLDTQDHYARSMTEDVIPLRTAIDAVNPVADLQVLLEAKKTNLHPETLVEYEPYVTEHSVDVPADPVENGGRANAPDLVRSRSKSMKPNESMKPKDAKDTKEIKDKGKKDKKNKGDDAPPSPKTPGDENASSAPSEPASPKGKPVDRSEESEDKHAEGAGAATAATAAAATAGSSTPVSPRRKDTVGSEKKPKTPRKKDGDKSPVARAMFDYEATDETEITFSEGDLIIITLYDGEVPDCPGWMSGRCKGSEGLFPANHVELDANLKLCKSTFDFDANEDEELAFKEGETLIIEATHESWFEGRNEKGQMGLFPSTYVTVL